MNDLSRKALAGFVKFQVFLGLVLFLPAGSWRFREAWIYWTVFAVSTALITLYFLKHDPHLIERRLEVGPGAETSRAQKFVQLIASVLLCVLFIVPGIDHRFHGPRLSMPVVLLADGLVLVSFGAIFAVFRANSHAGGVVKVETNQPVISTGPYRLVRHPMYAGASLLFLATPFALGSPWALIAAVPLCGTMVFRLLDEERFLSANLPGYDVYRRMVRYRLVPMVW